MPDRILEIGKNSLDSSDARVKVMMNNIVNAQTPGYKKSDVVIKSFPLYLEQAQKSIDQKDNYNTMVPQATGVYQNHLQGSLLNTGGKTDLAIEGKGYFVLQGPDGEVFTRDGRFHLNEDGMVVSNAGNYAVLGQGGPLMVIPGSKLEITKDGSVMIDDTKTDMIRVASFDDPQKLESINNSFFRIPPGEDIAYAEEDSPRIAQGFLESSNVNTMDETMNMIYFERMYGAMTKIIQTRDASLARAMEMGRPTQ